MPETLTDIYDRLRGLGRRRGKVTAGAGLLVAAAVLTSACALPVADPIPTRVCGTDTATPVRVADTACAGPMEGDRFVGGPDGPVLWWAADPDCLDAGDRTAVGAELDDDYLGEPCDPRSVVVAPPARPRSTWTVTTTPPRATTSTVRPAPTSTAAPRTSTPARTSTAKPTRR